jgi:hypothetical protein
MINHYIGFPFQIVTSLLGLWLYLIVASYFNWIQPIWWGGEALFPVIFGGISVLLSTVLLYSITFFTDIVIGSKTISYWSLLISALLLGFLFFPCFEIIVIVKNVIPGWSKLNPLFALTIGLILTSIMSIMITIFITIGVYKMIGKSQAGRSG